MNSLIHAPPGPRREPMIVRADELPAASIHVSRQVGDFETLCIKCEARGVTLVDAEESVLALFKKAEVAMHEKK